MKMARDVQTLVADLVTHFGDWFTDEHALAAGRMTCDLYPYERLFYPIQVNSIKIKNRIVMGPMGNISMAEETGRPNTKMIQYFTERAKGGAGLITSGLIPVWRATPCGNHSKGRRKSGRRVCVTRAMCVAHRWLG
jgi:2-enoate reductase